MTRLDNHEEWNTEEQLRLARLRREQTPPPACEDEIVHALQTRGLVQMDSIRSNTLPRLAGALAVAVLLLAIGFGLGKWQSQPRQVISPRSQFVLFLYDGDQTAEHEAERVEEYRNWAMRLRGTHKLVTGEKLKYSGRILRLTGGQLETSDLAREPRNAALGGYFLIAAGNIEEAARLAASCPHLRYGGSIAVREIDPT